MILPRSYNPLSAVLVGCGGISASWIESTSKLPDLQISGLVGAASRAVRILSVVRNHCYGSDPLAVDAARRTIDTEGWHDPIYKGPLEMTGQVAALHHPKPAAATTSGQIPSCKPTQLPCPNPSEPPP